MVLSFTSSTQAFLVFSLSLALLNTYLTVQEEATKKYIHMSSDELWFGFGNTIISMKLLSSVQQKEQTESKIKQKQVGVTSEEMIQCITLIHHNEQKYLWAAEVTVIGVWMVEG